MFRMHYIIIFVQILLNLEASEGDIWGPCPSYYGTVETSV